ncbi:MAG: hypothetical protein JSS65_07400 [Armatimonadetes bacterium]|nr:hypothetical protein [Armatimonadota bacterium]
MLLTDELIDRIHRFHVSVLRNFAKTYARISPDAAGLEVGGGFACFTGEGSPITQAFGLGHRTAEADLTVLDDFYQGRADNWELGITPFTSPKVVRQAVEMGYVPAQFETVLAQTATAVEVETIKGVEIVEVTGDLSQWVRVSEAGWAGRDELYEEISELGRLMSAGKNTRRFLATVDGEPAATAGLGHVNGDFIFAGAATLPKFRGLGLQRVLTQRRLAEAGPGSFVQFVALPGSVSHRNAQRNGFQPLYCNIQFFRRPPSEDS